MIARNRKNRQSDPRLYRRSPLPNQIQPPASHYLLIQPHLVRDLVGFDEDRFGFRGGFVSWVVEVHLYSCQPGLNLPLEETAGACGPLAVEWLRDDGTRHQSTSNEHSAHFGKLPRNAKNRCC